MAPADHAPARAAATSLVAASPSSARDIATAHPRREPLGRERHWWRAQYEGAARSRARAAGHSSDKCSAEQREPHARLTRKVTERPSFPSAADSCGAPPSSDSTLLAILPIQAERPLPTAHHATTRPPLLLSLLTSGPPLPHPSSRLLEACQRPPLPNPPWRWARAVPPPTKLAHRLIGRPASCKSDRRQTLAWSPA